MMAHDVLSAAELESEVAAAVDVMWSWRHVVRRIAGGVFGLGRVRATTPWTYLKRQLGYKVMLSAGLHTYVEGGLLRRRVGADARRFAVDDAEARRHYLGDDGHAPAPAATDDPRAAADIQSLPILTGNFADV